MLFWGLVLSAREPFFKYVCLSFLIIAAGRTTTISTVGNIVYVKTKMIQF